ncbi:WD40 repeat-like protein [Xylariaceae sp. AK1471]|nr:WD40 repeat-like protein [Xylariaceae sp. AK1471]
MATQVAATTAGREIIDLSSDDNEDVAVAVSLTSHTLAPLHLTHRHAPSSHTSFQHTLRPPLPASPLADLRVPNATSKENGHYILPTQSMEGWQGHTRPAKRQRLDASSEQQRQDVAAALGRCLEAQVFPHIERATETLPADVYDLDRLGAKVIRTIVDPDFERQFNQGKGRLSSSVELTIAAGVHRLVIELASGPDYRLPPTQKPTPDPPNATNTAAISTTLPAILPSIEKESDNDAGGDDRADVNSDDSDDLEEPEKSVGPVQPPRIRTPHRPPKRPKREKQLVSPQQLRTRAKARQWQSGKAYNPSSGAPSGTQYRSFGLPLRPYISAPARQQIISGVANTFLPLKSGEFPPSQVFHVDFSHAEIHYLRHTARKLYGKRVVNGERSTLRDLRNVLKKVPGMRASLAEVHRKGYIGYDPPPLSLSKRSSNDITNFLNDLYAKRLNAVPKSLFMEHSNSVAQSETSRATKIPALLLSREITGNRLGAARTYQNFITTVKSNREDYLEPQVEWTNCAGDIMTVSWLSNTDFVCGTTTHSDSHNQQYNKPGNLVLGSAATNTLRAYPDHRIVRPIVSSGDNALEAMVASQDPWLFTSVVSSDYDPSCGLAFTSSFDKTVKIWKPQDGSMTALGTWEHEGRVNFVVTSKNSTGTVATAADVPTEAVRVYHLDRSNISGSPYDSYSCTRVHDEDYVPSEKWAYYPAAIRWGLAPDAKHLLLIGYSPRSPTGEDHEIPEDKLNTGELCLWDTFTKTQVKVNSAKTQNVFEVAWHPSRASFAAATSASQILEKSDQLARTQVRIFEMNKESGQYGAIKTLDCAAVDINELSIMPNCLLYSYVAASCTDGKVYVWDTAGSDLPMCVLEHGEPVEELLGKREEEDVGVKFTAWATTADRLYTGSSDGVVKVWNIRHGRCVLVKDLIEVAAPITYGAFSPDFTKLVIGDGSGRVYLLALEDPEDEDPPLSPPGVSAGFLNVQTSGASQRTVRRSRPYLPHDELPPPGAEAHNEPSNKLMDGQKIAREYLNTAQLVLHPDPTVGVVQGVNYAQTGLFRTEAHVDEDLNEPLLNPYKGTQQDCQQANRQADYRRTWFPRQKEEQDGLGDTNGWHQSWYDYRPKIPWLNATQKEVDDEEKEIDLYHFDPATWQELKKEKAELDDSLIELDYETSIPDSDEDDW